MLRSGDLKIQDDFRGEKQPQSETNPQLSCGLDHPLTKEETGKTGQETQQWISPVSLKENRPISVVLHHNWHLFLNWHKDKYISKTLLPAKKLF